MSETLEEIVPIVPNTIDESVAVVTVEEAPELRYEYQPVDAAGRRIGGKQVILYRTAEELADKLRDQNVLLIRKLREVNTKNRLGISDDSAPESAKRLPAQIKIEKKTLSPEEQFTISQKIADPATFEEGRDQLLESAGWSSMQQAVEQAQYTTNQLLARANAQIFIETHSDDFYLCKENLETITDWMVKNGLEPSIENFELANSTLQEAELLLAAPIVREEAALPGPNTVPNAEPVAPVTRISDNALPQQPSQPARVPSGLNSRTASNTGTTPNGSTLSLAEIENMPSDVMKKRLATDPKFVADVNKLYENSARKKAGIRQ